MHVALLYEAGYYKDDARGGTTCLLGSSRYSVDLGVLVVRIVERRLEFTSPKKISIENVV